MQVLTVVVSKGVARLQFKRRQNGQVKRRRRVSRGAQGAERGEMREGNVALPAEGGSGRGIDSIPRKFFY